MNKIKLEQIMERNDFFQSEIESAINFIEDILLELADETERDEPYAINSIARYREAARVVRELDEDIWNAFENDEEE